MDFPNCIFPIFFSGVFIPIGLLFSDDKVPGASRTQLDPVARRPPGPTITLQNPEVSGAPQF